jgi:hypothetical protein
MKQYLTLNSQILYFKFIKKLKILNKKKTQGSNG